MKNITIVIALLTIFWTWIFPKYQIYNYEKEARDLLKNNFAQEMKQKLLSQPSQKIIKYDVLNHYPDIRIYHDFQIKAEEIPKLQEPEEFKINLCNQWNYLTSFDSQKREAFLNVLEKDKVTFHITVKDKFGQEVFYIKQRISECPNFFKIRNAKQGEVIEEPKPVTFLPQAAPAVRTSSDAAQY
ncbi:hypothetical protein [Acinetobacter seifertii]|uniref:Uncharacterized protein n=1 Tax=Acinetobacter seifertii TaxID=1530123 RepID=A0A7H2PSH4_9GAMM|nr:hypothetical protein [Acinetobacter seifertii]QNX05807.1 hypothetical protein IC796_02225 [Acinetobacter seifertii]QNX16261.1 hypothetical protein IC793_02385 [Acinetobacter seifertii]TDM61487.1 hypothetical protein C5B72_15595 [Acinetobacter sp. KU 011TH]TDM61604.1 hypothetical protein C4608_15605 [Acinetobacter sp. KU 013TH]